MKYDEICIYWILWWNFFFYIFWTDRQTYRRTDIVVYREVTLPKRPCKSLYTCVLAGGWAATNGLVDPAWTHADFLVFKDARDDICSVPVRNIVIAEFKEFSNISLSSFTIFVGKFRYSLEKMKNNNKRSIQAYKYRNTFYLNNFPLENEILKIKWDINIELHGLCVTAFFWAICRLWNGSGGWLRLN